MEHLPVPKRVDTMSNALRAKLAGFFAASNSVSAVIDTLCDDLATFTPGAAIVRQGDRYDAVYLIESGWALRAKALEDGGRQIVNVVMPGDFVALNALLFATSDFDHVCKTHVTAFRLRPDRLREMLAQGGGLAPALFWVNAHEESMLAERIVSLGRRSARVRTAHVLCEMLARLEIVAQGMLTEIAIPLSQEDLADVLGISVVHMNKVLKALEREEIITFRLGMLIVHNRTMLQRIAGFETGYLHFTQRRDTLP